MAADNPENSHRFYVNLGAWEASYELDPQLLELLLSDPEPPSDEEEAPAEYLEEPPPPIPAGTLGAMREFLAAVPAVRAALLLARHEESYSIGLVTTGAEPPDTCARLEALLKTVTPPEQRWTVQRAEFPAKTLPRLVELGRALYETAEFAASTRPA